MSSQVDRVIGFLTVNSGGRALTYDEIKRVIADEEDVEPIVTDVHMRTVMYDVRQRLKDKGTVETIRGHGYIFYPKSELESSNVRT